MSDYIRSLILSTSHYFPFNHHSLESIHISFAPSKELSKLHISSCFKAPTSCWILHKDQFPFRDILCLSLKSFSERDSESQIIYLLCIPSTVSKEMTHHNLIHKNSFIHLATITKMIIFVKNKRDIFFLKSGEKGLNSIID